jgi:hypothetical protein
MWKTSNHFETNILGQFIKARFGKESISLVVSQLQALFL